MTQKAFTTYHKQDCICRVAVETKKGHEIQPGFEPGSSEFQCQPSHQSCGIEVEDR